MIIVKIKAKIDRSYLNIFSIVIIDYLVKNKFERI